MGAGKSTIGRLLSGQLALPFKDSDWEIEQRSGADIPWIFDVEGEAGFRKREASIIDELSQLPALVLATGGGAIVTESTRNNLKNRGTVFYLETSVEQQFKRTKRGMNRPLLQQENRRQVLADLLAVRDPLYREAADCIIPTEQGNPKAVINSIRDYIGK